MSRAEQNQAKDQLNQQNQYAAGANTTAGNIYNTLFPQLQQNLTNPTANNPELASAGTQFQNEINNPIGLPSTSGYSTADKNAMTTASNQSLGGAVAGAVGQGNQTAARTRNAGGYATALDDAVRNAGRTQSQNALGVQEKSADLSAQQQAQDAQLRSQNVNAGLTGLENNANSISNIENSAMSGMEGLYGQNINELLGMMGMGPNTINAETNAGNNGWLQNTLGILGTAGQLGTGFGNLSNATGGFTKL